MGKFNAVRNGVGGQMAVAVVAAITIWCWWYNDKNKQTSYQHAK